MSGAGAGGEILYLQEVTRSLASLEMTEHCGTPLWEGAEKQSAQNIDEIDTEPRALLKKTD
ncbi:MAG: hypothetical protein CVU64_22330 [Deltaproteobacteria bacterium HGW-Deltaproteobacteria-21]|nr:MAG: hypothetical protein CVU64_22330 [Deltaproteobacteria bacterium HGW-Deltaproteobacteria-21]